MLNRSTDRINIIYDSLYYHNVHYHLCMERFVHGDLMVIQSVHSCLLMGHSFRHHFIDNSFCIYMHYVHHHLLC